MDLESGRSERVRGTFPCPRSCLMHLLLHTIAIEPARWTPTRVSRPLRELLPAIAGAGFHRLEIYEPHLALAPDEGALRAALLEHHLTPVVLSSYLDLSPHANPDERFAVEAQALLARVEMFGFRKVRLFPGRAASIDPAALEAAVRGVAGRLRSLALRLPEVEFLLETHDNSLADAPDRVLQVVEMAGCPNVGLLWQPTIFEPGAARAQFALQQSAVRHFHLQNRELADPARFATLRAGCIPWAEFLAATGFETDASIEFVPAGICSPEEFDLTTTLQQAVEEFEHVVNLEG